MSIRDILSQSEELDRDIPEEEPEQPQQPQQPQETQQEEEPQDDGTPVENTPVDVPESDDDVDTQGLEPVAQDSDGSVKDVDDLSYKPDGGWDDQEQPEPPDVSEEPDERQDVPQQESPPDLPDGELPNISMNDIRAPQMTDMEVDTGAPELPESEAIPSDTGHTGSMDLSTDYPKMTDVQSDSPDESQPQGSTKEDNYKEFSSKFLDNRQSQADDIAKSLAEEFRPMFEQSIERNKQAARDFMNMMISQQQMLGDE